jgi:isoleucyl-tRNA synthetase
MAEETKNVPSFKDTLNLPATEFPIRSNHKELDAQLLHRWQSDNLFHVSFTCNMGNKKFILHDGPPYVNGPIHLGHAYNKILKDLVTKSRRMAGFHVPVTPGFDCHGLPIEINVAKQYAKDDCIAFIKQCRAYANHWISVQTEQFKALGVLMDWAHPYVTMDAAYEAAILRAFAQFVERGFVTYNYKTVPWCASCQTSLASAEIEYKDRKDPSVFVLFPLVHTQTTPATLSHNASLLVWTTTPWTLPLNRAVAVKPDALYTALVVGDKTIVVAQALAERIKNAIIAKLTQGPVVSVGEFKGSELVGLSVQQPLTDRVVPVIANPAIALDEGTACVHVAPGCGPEDYMLGIAQQLEIYSPVTADGHYTADVLPADLAGKAVVDAQTIIIDRLRAQGRLLHAGTVTHAYPHCWRCRNGLLFRATKQWFLSLAQEGLRDAAVAAIDTITFIPEQSRNNLKAAVESRLEWCISRQRVWGVPITALLCKTCGEPYITRAFVEQVAAQVAQEGIEYWHRADVGELSHNVKCAHCGGTDFKKELDILDVWFDSGVSHCAVLKNNPALAFPADVYLEGRDQARGWFQSSLLTSVVLDGQPAMRSIITHGYAVDANRAKMSKSVGNVVAPSDIVEQYGTDVLRLWAASIDYVDDAVVSDVLLRNLQEVYRKMRNTLRFLLSNINDFSFERDMVADSNLMAIDLYALQTLAQVDERVRAAYERADFTAVVHELTDYCTNELSSLYLDIIKDRLYCEAATGHARRSAQTVCWRILDTLTHVLAPILSFTMEQVSDYYQKNKTKSIHLQPFVPVILGEQHDDQATIPLHVQTHFPRASTMLSAVWPELFAIRSSILKAIELQREQGIIKHSLESNVLIFFDKEFLDKLAPFLALLAQRGQTFETFLREYCIISQVSLVTKRTGTVPPPSSSSVAPSAGQVPPGSRGQDFGEKLANQLAGLEITVERARGVKCPRCWQYEETTHEYQLCTRCARLVDKR